jgi:hypothetical protein
LFDVIDGRGNLHRQVVMLRELGVRTGKSLPRNLLEASAADDGTLALTAEPAERSDAELCVNPRKSGGV